MLCSERMLTKKFLSPGFCQLVLKQRYAVVRTLRPNREQYFVAIPKGVRPNPDFGDRLREVTRVADGVRMLIHIMKR
jgi:hypothetical protein